MAVSFTPGQTVAAPDWEALFAQHGGSQSTQLRPPTKQEQEAADNAGDDLEQNPIYRYYAADGSYVEARKAPNGDYQIIDYKPSAKFTQAQGSTATQKPTIGRVEGTPLPGGGFDNTKPIWVERDANGQQVGAAKPLTKEQRDQWEREKNGGKTDAEIRAEQTPQSGEVRKPVEGRPGWTSITRTTVQGGNKTETTVFVGPDGKEVPTLPEKPTTAALVGNPTGNTRARTENGQSIKEVEYVLPNGTKEWRTQTAPGDDKDAFGVEPEGAPPMVYTIGQMSAGLRTYSQFLSEQVKLHKDTNGAQGISPQEATKLMERRIALAESTLKEQAGLVNVQASQRGQDITQRGQSLTETQSRRGAAERIYQDIQTRGDERLKYLRPEDAADHIAARDEELRNALAYAGLWGGLRESPEIPASAFPELAAIRRASMAGIQTAAQGGPRIFDQRTPGPPPAVPSGAEVEAANQAAQAGFREAAGPLLPPPPPAPAASAAPIVPPAVNPIDAQPIVLPSQLPTPAPSGPPERDDHRLDAGLTPMVPFVPPEQYQPAQPVNMDPSQGPMGMAPPFMGDTRYGAGNYFDPDLAGSQLSTELGIDPEIMRQAISSLYG